MAFPSTLSTFNRPSANDRLNSPSHSALHNTVSSALGQVEAVVGVNGINSVVGTMMYDLRSPASKGGGHIQGAAFGGTGQTSFTKGDILVAQSASVLSKLSAGADGATLVARSSSPVGIVWSPGSTPTVTSFLSSGTWSKPSFLSAAYIEVWGGGGSGGNSTLLTDAASGGGGGAYNVLFVNASILGLTELAMVGLGGASVTGAADGNPGGMTVFGVSSLVSAFGGAQGVKTATGAGGGGGGGIASVGVNSASNTNGGPGGGYARGVASVGGVGGDSTYGGGAGGSSDGTTCFSGGNAVFGGAGGGASDDGDSAGGNGGNSLFGGAGGGGGGAQSGANRAGIGGVSRWGGNGGGSVAGAPGSVPGGGGAGNLNNGTSGKGGDGKIVITEYY